MSAWGLLTAGPVEVAGTSPGTSQGTTVTASATPDTKGSWAQIVASTAYPASELIVSAVAPSAESANTGGLLDIAFGAASSEQVILEDLSVPAGGGGEYQTLYRFPVNVPAGTRIAAAFQEGAGSGVRRVFCMLAGHGFADGNPGGLVTTYGADTANSQGTTLQAAATANTKGSYVELAASTTYPIHALALALSHNANNATSNGSFLLDIAIGAASSEQVILGDIGYEMSTQEQLYGPQPGSLIPVAIPAGSRIAARVQSTITNSVDRQVDLVVYGVTL